MLALLGSAFAADVTLSGARWHALQAPELPEVVPPGPHAADRTVLVSKQGDGLSFTATYSLKTDAPGWFRAVLMGRNVRVESLRYEGRDVGLNEQRELVLWIDKPGLLQLSGAVEERVSVGVGPLLGLMAATRGTVRVPQDWAIAADGMVSRGKGEWQGGADDLAVVGKAAVQRSGRALVRAQVALGITVGDAAAAVQAHAVWSAAQGGMDSVSFSVPGAGPDLKVSGAQVASHERSGDRVTVKLREANMPVADLLVSWSVAVPQGEAASLDAPRLLPEGTFRSSFITKLARDGDVEVVPEGNGWEARAFAELPPWSEGLVAGSPTAALSSSKGDPLRLQLLRFEPVSGPATIIDVASTSMALSDEGRVILRTHLQVRNDRGAFLTVTPPPGFRFIGASVAGEIAEPFEEGRSWRIAMKKSVETVDGLLSFPVRMILVGELEPFERRTRMSIPLPSFDAEVAAHRVSVNLPMGLQSKLPVGEKYVVDAFSEGDGITYGFALGDARASEADALFQTAVQSWMANDFEAAQSTLRVLNDMGAASQDVSRLQGNLDLVFGDEDGKSSGAATASSRRVKEQAKARSIDEEREQSRILIEAQQAELAGDYAAASSGYQQALGSGKKLARLDQAEEKGNAYKNAEFEKKLEELEQLQAVADKRDMRYAEERAVVDAQDAAREAASAANAAAEQHARSLEENHRRAEAAEMARVAEESGLQAARGMALDERDLGGRDSPLEPEDYEEESLQDAMVVRADEIVIHEPRAQNDRVKLEKESKESSKYKERVEIDFEDVDIVGELVKPQGQLLPNRRKTGAPEAPPPPPPPPPPMVAAPVRPSPKPMAQPSPVPPQEVVADPVVAVEDGWIGDDYAYDGVPGGVEGGVVGGLVGGSFGGVVATEAAPVETDSTSPSTLLTKDFVQQVPAGRSYQSALQTVAGVSGRTKREKKKAVDVSSTSNSTVLGRSGAVGGHGGNNPNMAGGASNENVYRSDDGEEMDSSIEHKPAKEPKPTKEQRRREQLAAPPPSYKPPADRIDISMGDSDELPDVKATTLDVIVPALGETVRYQHLLVPAGAQSTVYIETRPLRARRKP